MCPNCYPAGSALASGYIIALAICGIFFVAAVASMFLASKTGHLDDLEDTKFKMLQD